MKPVFWLTAALIAVFVAISLFVPSDTMNEALRAGVFVAACWGIMRWGPAAWRVYFRGAQTTESWGILGIALFLSAEAAQSVYAVVYLNLDRPEWMQLLHVSPFLVYVKLIALSLFIAATRFPGEKPSKVGTVGAALLAFLGLMLTATGPKIGAIVARWLEAMALAQGH